MILKVQIKNRILWYWFKLLNVNHEFETLGVKVLNPLNVRYKLKPLDPNDFLQLMILKVQIKNRILWYWFKLLNVNHEFETLGVKVLNPLNVRYELKPLNLNDFLQLLVLKVQTMA